MKTNRKTFTQISFFFIFTLFFCANLSADIIKLIDGSVIQGKIVREDTRIYFFTNTHGTFEIKRVNIKNIYITKSYEEDMQLNKKYNFKIDETLMKQNYQAGVRKKTIMGKSNNKNKLRQYYEYWDYGRLSISAAYFATISQEKTDTKNANEHLPSGFSGLLAYEQGLDMLLYKKSKSKNTKQSTSNRKFVKTKPRPPMMPGLRIEFSYLYFTKDLFVDNNREISGSMYTVGPMWSFPSPHNVWGCFVLAAMPGMSFVKVKNRAINKERDQYTFGLTMIFGYEYAIKEKVGLLFHARYTYIADQQVSFHGIGASYGLAFRLW